MCGYRGDRHIALAAAVEFIHTATLLHDDVVDASDLRRGLATANAVWGNKSLGAGRRFPVQPRLPAHGRGRLARACSTSCPSASAIIAEGEVLQLVTSNDTATTEEAYLAVIQAKTAQLFAAASRIGAVLAERPEDGGAGARGLRPQSRHRLPARRRHARLFGAAGRARQDGRRRFPRGQDHPAGRAGLRARPTRRSAASGAARSRTSSSSDGDLERAIELMTRHGTLRATLDRARAIRRDGTPRAGAFPRRARAAGARRGHRFLPGARLLIACRRCSRPREGSISPGAGV